MDSTTANKPTQGQGLRYHSRMKTLALTIIGADRPGIVAELSDLVARYHGNWMESRMANLAGQFAGIVQIQIDSAQMDALQTELEALEQNGLKIVTAESRGESSVHRAMLEIELLGRDHVGIVQDVTQALADIHVTIDEMKSDCFSGSMSGGDMFRAWLRVGVPADVSYEMLEASLHKVSNDLMVDLLIDEPRS